MKKWLFFTYFVFCSLIMANHPLNNPDQFAWELFIQINSPADTKQAGFPDVSKKIGDKGKTVWETWGLARYIYANPNIPPQWLQTVIEGKKYEELETDVLQQLIISKIKQNNRETLTSKITEDELWELEDEDKIDFENFGSEVRINFAAFQHIVANEFYNIEGQEAVFQMKRTFDFPEESKEIKARWKKLSVGEQHKYHTALVQKNDGTIEEWGLIALHITTKDIPNWFWATFEHKENLGLDAVVPTIDKYGLPKVLEKTKWENYVLRGTQTGFIDSIGRPIILANSVIERQFQETSSCMSCHARATIGAKPRLLKKHQQGFFIQNGHDVTRLSVFENIDPLIGSIGIPNPNWFVNNNTVPQVTKFIQTDFVWSLLRAKRKKPFWQNNEER